MNRIIKSALMLLGTVLAFSSCTSEYEYDGFAKISGNQVYFDKDAASTIEISTEKTSFPITLGRAVTTEAITVPLTVSQPENSIYSVPKQASFAAGESTTTINVTYDPANIVFGNYETITISLAGDSAAYSTPYGNSSYTFKAGVTAWVPYGTALYREDCLTTFYNVENVIYELELEKNTMQEGLYRLKNPYGANYPYNDPGDWDESKDYYMTIDATDPNMVYLSLGYTGMAWSYGEFYINSYVDLKLRNGATLEEVKASNPELFGTLVNNVVTMPVRSMLIGMDDYNDGGLYYGNTNGMLAIALPGGVIADYAVQAAYAGKFIAASGEESILASGKFGEDIASAKAYLVQDKLTSESLSAILSGEVEGVDMELSEIEDEDFTFGGSAYLAMAADAPTGTYTIVVVGFDADGEAQDYDYAEFKYQNPNDTAPTYTAWAIGDYTYTVFFGSKEEPYVDADLEIARGDSNPNRFKVSHWGYDVDFYFEFQEDGSVLVDDQETGYVHSSYGMVSVRDYVTAAGTTEYGQSSYDPETGTFSFLVNYYVSAGSFGSGVETLEIKSAAVNARLAEAQRKAMAGGKNVTKKTPKLDRKNVNPLNYSPVLWK